MTTTGESSKRPEAGSNNLPARITVGTMEGFSSALRGTVNARQAITRSFALSSHWRNRDLGSLTLISRLQGLGSTTYSREMLHVKNIQIGICVVYQSFILFLVYSSRTQGGF